MPFHINHYPPHFHLAENSKSKILLKQLYEIGLLKLYWIFCGCSTKAYKSLRKCSLAWYIHITPCQWVSHLHKAGLSPHSTPLEHHVQVIHPITPTPGHHFKQIKRSHKVHLDSPGHSFVKFLTGKHIFVLTIAGKHALAKVYFIK